MASQYNTIRVFSLLPVSKNEWCDCTRQSLESQKNSHFSPHWTLQSFSYLFGRMNSMTPCFPISLLSLLKYYTHKKLFEAKLRFVWITERSNR
jgi:hypothetical protein